MNRGGSRVFVENFATLNIWWNLSLLREDLNMAGFRLARNEPKRHSLRRGISSLVTC